MVPVFDEGQVSAWMHMIYGEADGYINIVSTDNWAGRCFQDADQAVSYVKQLELRQPKGIYARATTLREVPGDKERGGVNHTSEFLGFWADLDIAGPGHKTDKKLPPSIEECMAIIEVSGLPAPTEWVHSGGGMYPWWLLTTPHHVEKVSNLEQTSADWQRLIELASEKLGYHYGAGVGDLARVLRIPGTINRKVADSPAMCEWRVDLSTSQPYDLIQLVDSMTAGLKMLEKPKPVTSGFTAPAASVPGSRPGDAFNAATTWPQLLEADGAQVFRDRGIGYIEWTRPGKDRRDGMSATTGYKGSDVLKVFTDSWPSLRQGETYDRFGYYAATQHNGSIREATKALAVLGYGEKPRWEPPKPVEYTFHQDASGWGSDDVSGGWTASAGTMNDFGLPIANSWATADSLPAVAAMAKAPGPKPTYTFTESGMADRMQARYGDDWRFVATRQRFGWLKWDGKTWQTDKKGAVTNLVDQLAKEAYEEASQIEDDKEREKAQRAVKTMLSNSKQVGTTAQFSRRSQVAIDATDLDAVKSKVTCSNGTLDLNSMAFGNFDRDLLATKKLGVAYDAAAKAPKWEKFLSEVLPDPSVREYLQRAVGYTLLGDPVRKAIFMLHGPSHTGKSQVINALAAIFGDFAEGAKEQTFRVNDSANGPTPGLHKLRGARLVTASESTEGVKLDEALIKQLTGGDTICSRPLYGDEESWVPEFSIWLATNHLPKFNSDDNAIWRRVKPIHFAVEFGKDDRKEVMDIGRTLVAEEGPGILNWILEGVKRYQEFGLVEPDTLTAGVAAYQQESDPVARFIASAVAEGALIADTEAKIESKTLYSWFQQWCADEGIRHTLPATRFGRRLTLLGYGSGRDSTGNKRVWHGLAPGENTFVVTGQRWRE